jgi:hypothetical protein
VTAPWIVAYGVLAAVVLVVAVLMLGVLRRVVPLLENVEAGSQAMLPAGLPLGSRVPEFVALAPDGSPFDESDLGDDPAVLLFIGAGCPPCEALAAEVRAHERRFPARVVAIAVDTEANRDFLSGLPLEVAYHDGSVTRAFETSAMPHAFAISGGAVMRAAVPHTVADLGALALAALKGGDRLADRDNAVA